MAVAYALLLAPFGGNWVMIPGLSLGKLYACSMLVLLNSRFTIIGGRNDLHPTRGIPPEHRRPDAADNAGQGTPHNMVFAHSRVAETTFVSLRSI